MISDIKNALQLTSSSYGVRTAAGESELEEDQDDHGIELSACISTATLIAVGGNTGSGKSIFARSFCEALTDRSKQTAVLFGFDDAIKGVIGGIFDVTVDFVDEWRREKSSPPGLDASMQSLITHVRELQKFNPTMWIRRALAEYDKAAGLQHKNHCDIEEGPADQAAASCVHWWIAADVRSDLELNAVRERDGLLILVARTPITSDGDTEMGESGQLTRIEEATRWFLKHTKGSVVCVEKLLLDGAPSAVNEFHYFVRNDGTEDDLRRSGARLAAVVAAEA